MITIYGKSLCPSCTKAKQLCESHNYPFKYLELGKDFDRQTVMEMFPEARTFPQIIINNNKIGGYEQLLSYIDATNYNGTGHSLS
tara:strand:+ start:1577 stop:1831 length:255 start_codon:yes stop_codon:yes gene_type:complete